jgi:hypothetical protein
LEAPNTESLVIVQIVIILLEQKETRQKENETKEVKEYILINTGKRRKCINML